MSWDYGKQVLVRMESVDSMLDMGTGGGEFLASLAPLPKRTFATEAYPPNVPIARMRLEPLGVKVVQIGADDNLPFGDETFALVINRHESFSAKEVYRILRGKGVFITQQVGDRNAIELNELLEKRLHGQVILQYPDWNVDEAASQLESEGFQILDRKEELASAIFYDVGAVVYYLKAVPWQIRDFDMAKYREQLREVHNLITQKGGLKVTAHRFYIESVKP